MIVSHLNCSWSPYIKIFCHIHVWKATFQILGNIWSQSSTRFEIIRLLTPSLRKVFHMIRPRKPRSACHSKCSQSRQHISRRRSRQWKERRRWLSRTFWGFFFGGEWCLLEYREIIELIWSIRCRLYICPTVRKLVSPSPSCTLCVGLCSFTFLSTTLFVLYL